ncbi:MAG: AAA family ATPase, partial [Clostridia bacterium]
PVYPNGWEKWSKRMREVVGEPIDAFFVGDMEYSHTLATNFPEAKMELFDPKRTRYPISATDIRENILGNWHYILGAARPFFAKKVLIAGTESCGKTTLTKCLAKLFNTSWSEEVGRYYAEEFLGNDETIYTDMDFSRIAHIQYEQDYQALRTANKVCFFDTDATYTDYFSELYMGHRNELVEKYIDHTRYDLLIYLTPDVKWVADGQRLHGDEQKRKNLNDRLLQMYRENGFENKIVMVGGDYTKRLSDAIALVDDLLGGMKP